MNIAIVTRQMKTVVITLNSENETIFFSFKLILRSRWRRCVWDQGGGEGEGDGGAKRARTGQTNTFYSLSVYWHGPVTHGTSLTRRH